jgi:AcrR family transcriptional regulator
MAVPERFTSPRTGRRPGVGNSRDGILAAARQRFSEQGYAGTTIRDIASDAGVDGALIIRFFGSKDGLFSEAMAVPPVVSERMDRALEGDPAQLGERIVRTFLGLWDDPATSPPLLAMFRSVVTNEHAAHEMRTFLEARMVSSIAPRLTSSDAALRASLAAAQMLGVAFARNVLGVPTLSTAQSENLVRVFGPAIQATLAPMQDTAPGRGSSL